MRGQRERVTLANELTGPCAVPRRNFTTRAGGGGAACTETRCDTELQRGETHSEQHLRTNRQNLWARLVSGARGIHTVSERHGWVVKKSDLGGASAFLWRVSRLQYGKTGGADPAVAAVAKPGRSQRHLATLPQYL